MSRPAHCTFKTLFRLYDLPGSAEIFRQADALGLKVRPMIFDDLPQVDALIASASVELDPRALTVALSRSPVTCTVALARGSIVAAGFYNVRSPGTAGPIVVAGDAPRGAARAMLVSVLGSMYRLGYRYAVDNQLPAALCAELGKAFGMLIPEPDLQASAADRDLPDMPWADIFVRLDVHAHPPWPQVPSGEHFVEIRRPEPSEGDLVIGWIRDSFGRGWASEIQRSFTRDPISCAIAVHSDTKRTPEERLLGFSAWDACALGAGSTIAVHRSVSDVEIRWRTAMLLMNATGFEMFSRGYEYIIATGISKRVLFLDAAPGSVTIPKSYPGPFGKVIAYK